MDTESNTARLVRGTFAGLVAGTVASFAMDRFQAAATAMSSSNEDAGDDEEPSTAKAADSMVGALTGRDVPTADKPLAGQIVHYALGIGLGIVYGVAAEFRPAVTTGYGTAFGIGTATLLDEAAVPAVGLGEVPWKAGFSSSLYSYASHLVFGCTTELVRSQVAATLKP